MTKSQDLFDLREVCAYYGYSESTVRRRVRDAREGKGSFPLPLFPSRSRNLWKRSDIENWSGEKGEVITFTPSLVSPMLPVRPQNLSQVHKGLQALGVKLPVQQGNESDN